MINLTYNNLADGLHVAIGALFVFGPTAMGWFHGAQWGSLAGFIYAVVKEFYVDLNFEDPQTSGGLIGGLRDFMGYVIGIVAANVILLL